MNEEEEVENRDKLKEEEIKDLTPNKNYEKTLQDEVRNVVSR